MPIFIVAKLVSRHIFRDFAVLYQHGDFDNDRFDDAFEEFCRFHPFPESVMYIGEERLSKAVSPKSLEEYASPCKPRIFAGCEAAFSVGW